MTRSQWVSHNHLTRDIKKPGICPACDLYLQIVTTSDNEPSQKFKHTINKLIEKDQSSDD